PGLFPAFAPEAARLLDGAEECLAEQVLGQSRVMAQAAQVAEHIVPVAVVEFLHPQHGGSLLYASGLPINHKKRAVVTQKAEFFCARKPTYAKRPPNGGASDCRKRLKIRCQRRTCADAGNTYREILRQIVYEATGRLRDLP